MQKNPLTTQDPNQRNYRKSKLDVGRILTLRYAKGLTYQEIADLCGVTKSAVIQRLQHLPSPQAVSDYVNNKTKILSSVELSLVSLLNDPTKQSKASLNNVAYAFQSIHNSNRLEAGLSTSNIAYADMVKAKESLAKERQELEQETTSSTS